MTLILSCQTNPQINKEQLRNLELAREQRRQDSVTADVMKRREEAHNITKFLVVIVNTDQPVLVKEKFDIPDPEANITKGKKSSASLSTGLSPEPIDAQFLKSPSNTIYTTSSVSNPFFYLSEVYEINEFNEDKKFVKMDEFEKSILNSLGKRDKEYKIDHYLEFEGNSNVISKVTGRYGFLFDTYKEASEFRSKSNKN